MSAELTPLSQEQAEEEAIAALGIARETYDLAVSRLQNALDFHASAKEQLMAARAHFHAISQRSTEGL